MSDFSGLSRNAAKVVSKGYRTLNLKTVAISEARTLAVFLSSVPGSRVAYCVHPADGDFVEHIHLVAQFPQPQHLAKQLTPIASIDPCFYLKPCRLFRASYRYLAHLDNPEKCRIPVSSIVRLGDWDGTDLSQWHAARIQSVNMQELLSFARDYIRSSGELNPIAFACWLDANNVNSRSALSGLRQMGLSFEGLISYAEYTLSPLFAENQPTPNRTTDP